MRVIQYVVSFSRGDAVSNDARAIYDLLKGKGFDTEIYAENFNPKVDTIIHPVRDLPILGPDDIFIYHHSIFSGLVERINDMCCRKVMIYHNITPEEYFLSCDAKLAQLCRKGRKELAALKNSFDFAIADSEYNSQELQKIGYSCPIRVCPILIPFDDYSKKPDGKTIDKYSDGWTNLLFVGRVAPNKRQEDIIRAFNCYKKSFNSKSRLILVGSTSIERYFERLKCYIELNEIQDVVFPGHISFAEILAFYQTADVFLCLSEHEGFCVPLLEAMCFQVPIIAYEACAVPNTLGEGGVLLQDRSPEFVASAIDRVVKDRELREWIVEKQQERLDYFSYNRVSEQFLQLFYSFLEMKENVSE